MTPLAKKRVTPATGWTPLCALLVAMLWGAAGAEAEDGRIGAILHLTRRTAVVDMGEADGLEPLAELRVFRGGREIGRLAVEYLAQRSAACTIIAATDVLAPGDEVRFVPVFPAAFAPGEPPSLAEPVPDEPRPRRHTATSFGEEPSRMHGRVTLEWSYFADAKDTRRDFEQSAVYARLDGRRLWQRPVHFQLRLRTRYDHRNQAGRSSRPETEWLHRVYQLSLTYDDPRCPARVALGRLFVPRVPSAGNWDGALLECRLGTSWQLFAFGGGLPRWADGQPDFDQQKAGGGLSLTVGEPGGRVYEGTAAFVGEYVSGDVGREFIALGNWLSLGRVLSLRQTLELDVNRDWRRDAAGESRTLSRLNTDLFCRAGARLQISLGYSYYQSVPRIESRDVPDSLRIDAELAGMRLSARLKLSRTVRVGGSLGYRERRGEEKRPLFGSADLRVSDLLRSGADLALRHAYADGRFADSRVPSLELERSFGPALRIGLGLGAQRYEGFQAEPLMLGSRWFTFHGTYRLSRPLDLSWIWRRASGDLGAGDRFLLQLGCRW